MINISPPLTLSLQMSLCLKYVSSRQHVGWSYYFLIHFVMLYLLIVASSQFTFKEIIERYLVIAVLLFVLFGFFGSVSFLAVFSSDVCFL